MNNNEAPSFCRSRGARARRVARPAVAAVVRREQRVPRRDELVRARAARDLRPCDGYFFRGSDTQSLCATFISTASPATSGAANTIPSGNSPSPPSGASSSQSPSAGEPRRAPSARASSSSKSSPPSSTQRCGSYANVMVSSSRRHATRTRARSGERASPRGHHRGEALARDRLAKRSDAAVAVTARARRTHKYTIEDARSGGADRNNQRTTTTVHRTTAKNRRRTSIASFAAVMASSAAMRRGLAGRHPERSCRSLSQRVARA